jgi:PKD repeat protein
MKRILLAILVLSATLCQSLAHAVQYDLQVNFSFVPTLDCPTAGFRLYNEYHIEVCEITDPNVTTMTCPNVEISGNEAAFTLTSFCTDGRESPPSDPFTLTVGLPQPLDAIIQANSTSGHAPFEVILDATNSTGDITSYSWAFGDGSPTASGDTVAHQFAAAGNYTVILTVTDVNGGTDTAQKIITVSSSSGQNTPPAAVISASTTVGTTPLSVTFYGASSTDADGDNLIYTWDFGDGTSSSGSPTVSHTYTIAGTYQAVLTVSDGKAQTTTSPLPVIISSGEGGGFAAVARISTSRQLGMAPLMINFDGSLSTPSTEDGEIVRFEWSFGDGGIAQSALAGHTFSTAGNYTVTLTVTDDTGNTDTTSVTISVLEAGQFHQQVLMTIYKLLLIDK